MATLNEKMIEELQETIKKIIRGINSKVLQIGDSNNINYKPLVRFKQSLNKEVVKTLELYKTLMGEDQPLKVITELLIEELDSVRVVMIKNPVVMTVCEVGFTTMQMEILKVIAPNEPDKIKFLEQALSKIAMQKRQNKNMRAVMSKMAVEMSTLANEILGNKAIQTNSKSHEKLSMLFKNCNDCKKYDKQVLLERKSDMISKAMSLQSSIEQNNFVNNIYGNRIRKITDKLTGKVQVSSMGSRGRVTRSKVLVGVRRRKKSSLNEHSGSSVDNQNVGSHDPNTPVKKR